MFLAVLLNVVSTADSLLADVSNALAPALGSGVKETDVIILAIPALVWLVKFLFAPVDDKGSAVGRWRILLPTLTVALSTAYMAYRGGADLMSVGRGIILGVVILGGRNYLQRLRGK